jgi:hypothetical protein
MRKWSRGIPVCLDSRHLPVLTAGLKAWFDTQHTVEPPLLRWPDYAQISTVLQLKKDHDVKVCASILNDEMDEHQPSLEWIDKLHKRAQSIHELATTQHGFKAGDIILECRVLALADEKTDTPDVPSHTHVIFNGIQRIKQDRQLKHLHCCLAIDDATAKLPGRKIGVCRAYVAAAMEFGMDAYIADAQKAYGESPADDQLQAMVTAFAQMAGGADQAEAAKEGLDKFFAATAKPKPKPKAAPEPKAPAIPIEAVEAAPKKEAPKPSEV